MQLEAKEPAHRGLAALGQSAKTLCRQCDDYRRPAGRWNRCSRARSWSEVADEEDHQRHEGTFLQATSARSTACRESAAQQRLGKAVIEALGCSKPELWSTSSSVMISLVDRPGCGPRAPVAITDTTPPIVAQTPGRNHRPRKKPRRSDPTSSPPSLSDGRLPKKPFTYSRLMRETLYPGYSTVSNPTTCTNRARTGRLGLSSSLWLTKDCR